MAAPFRTLGGVGASLKTHLFVFAAALVLPLLFVVGLALVSSVTSERTKSREELINTAMDISSDVNREVSGYLSILKTLSTSTLLDRGRLEEFHARVQAALFDHQAAVLLLDPSLHPLLNTRVPYRTPLPETSGEESAQTVLTTGSPSVSDAHTDPESGQTVVSVQVPVTSKGRVKYVLVIMLPAQRFGEILSGADAEDFVITLSDRKGQIIARIPKDSARSIPPTPQHSASGTVPTIFEREEQDGMRWIDASVWSTVTGWQVTVSASGSQLDAVLWTSVRWFCAAIGVAILMTILFGAFIGRRLTEPIVSIKQATVELARGKPVEPRELALTEASEVMNALSRTSALIASRSARLQESEERSREQVRQIDTLMHELAHRNKNQLSVIVAMARQLAGTCDNVEEFLEKLTQRITAMARAQDILSQGAGTGVPLRQLLDNQIRPFVGENSPQLMVSGPDAFLTAEAARSIGMAFHELATNATKYGALKSPEGRISVTWSISEPDRRLRIEWREQDGPAVDKPDRVGFGHTIIEKYVARTLSADVDYRFDTSGIVWTVEAEGMLV
jgi:two-component sensor histidine kinase